MATSESRQAGAQEWHLHAELEHECGRLVQHPREEIHRLREEAESGESGATIGILLTALGVWLVGAIVLILGLAFLGYYLTL